MDRPTTGRSPDQWEIVNDQNTAKSVGLHDLDDLSLDVIVDGARTGFEIPDGFLRHIVLALALGNVHAANFLNKWYLRPSNTAPTPEQARHILDAAKDTGLDPHQLHTLAKCINLYPAGAGIILPGIGQEELASLDDIEILGVPYENAEFLRNAMRQQT